jgi:HEAT repeat protein
LVLSSGAETVEPANTSPQFHVRCARELFEALESPDGTTRLAALQAVQNAPETAFSFGLHAKRDLIDVLLSQAERLRGEFEWLNWIGALAAFHDPRVFRLFASLISTESHSQLLFALANYLQTEPVDSIRTQLGAALMQNDCVSRARALAPVLLPHPGLSAAESLRIGLLQPADENPLPLFSAAIEEWLNELNGPFQSESQIELKRQGAATLATLVSHWDRLLESSKKWLLQWAAEIDADLVIDAIRKVLAKETDAIALAALEAAANLKNFPADLEILIAPFLEDSDPLVRRAAIRSCRSASDWRLFFEKEPSALVRQTCISKVIDQEGMNAVPFVLQQLANPDWRIRAAAAEGLLLLGNPGVRAAITILPEASASARISIGRMVIYSADEGLLDEFIRSCPH